MGTRNRIPVTDADFNNYANIAIPYLTTNKARLVITTTAQANLTAATSLLTTAATGWNSVYPLTLNPATATATIIASKTNQHKQIEKLLRAIYDDIPRSVLTQMDRDTLNIPAPSGTHTASTRPESVPSITISGRGHLSATLTILDVEHQQPLSNVDDADLIELEAAFLAPGAAAPAGFPSDNDFHHVATLSKSTVLRTYTPDQQRGTEYLKACYLSSRNEPGGWSEVVSVVVA